MKIFGKKGVMRGAGVFLVGTAIVLSVTAVCLDNKAMADTIINDGGTYKNKDEYEKWKKETEKKTKKKEDCKKAGKTWYDDKCMTKEEAEKAKEKKEAESGGGSGGISDAGGKCGKDEIETALFGCVKNDNNGGPVFKLLGLVVKVLTFGVGSLAVFGLVFSGLQYATARDNEAQVKKARERIMNIVIGLVLYALAYTIISWLIPGGL